VLRQLLILFSVIAYARRAPTVFGANKDSCLFVSAVSFRREKTASRLPQNLRELMRMALDEETNPAILTLTAPCSHT